MGALKLMPYNTKWVAATHHTQHIYIKLYRSPFLFQWFGSKNCSHICVYVCVMRSHAMRTATMFFPTTSQLYSWYYLFALRERTNIEWHRNITKYVENTGVADRILFSIFNFKFEYLFKAILRLFFFSAISSCAPAEQIQYNETRKCFRVKIKSIGKWVSVFVCVAFLLVVCELSLGSVCMAFDFEFARKYEMTKSEMDKTLTKQLNDGGRIYILNKKTTKNNFIL